MHNGSSIIITILNLTLSIESVTRNQRKLKLIVWKEQ